MPFRKDIESLSNRVKDKMEEQMEAEGIEGRGYSFPFGIPLIVYPLLFVGALKGEGAWWGIIFHVLFMGIVALFGVEAIRKGGYDKIHKQYPDLNRTTWVLNYLLFFVLLPLMAWALFFVVGG